MSSFALGALDLTGLHAGRADACLADMAVLFANRDLLHVRAEDAVRHAVRVADVAAGDRVLAADFTNSRHTDHSVTIDSVRACKPTMTKALLI